MASLGRQRDASARNGSVKDNSPCFSNRSDTFRREMQVADALVEKIRTKGGLEVKNRSYHLRSFYTCFVASELVDWLVQNGEAASREEGVELGQLLVRSDYIHHVVDEHHFEDIYLFFRFRQDEPPMDVSGPTMTCLRGQEGSLIGQLYRKRFFGYSGYTYAFSPSNCHLYQFRNELAMTSTYSYDLNGATVRPEARVQANRYFFHISMADKKMLTLAAEDSETQLKWLKVFADNDIEILPSEEDEDDLVKKALSAYDFTARDIDGEMVSLSLAEKNYTQLVQLNQEFAETQGLRILAFPCNQFANQEPGTEEDIKRYAAGFGVKFDMFSKIDVNGSMAHPLFKYLKKQLPGNLGSFIKWNYTKFLCDVNGIPIKRYGPNTPPLDIVPDFLPLLRL